jgi:hypothetical protein
MNVHSTNGCASAASSWILAALVSTALLGCGEATDADQRRDQAGTNPAVLVGVFVQNPEGRNIYVGAVSDLPAGELDYSDFLEFGNVDVYTHGGWVFVWDRDAATMTRYGVREDLSFFPDGEKLGFSGQTSGAEFYGGAHALISETRAYTLSSELDRVIVWNPSSLEITGTIAMEPPETPEGFSASPMNPIVVGDRVVWQITTTNYDAQRIEHSVMLAVAAANADTPVRYIVDERCAGANGAHIDEDGDLYVRADGYWGFYAAYADPASEVQTCVLRLRRGATEFDPDYLVSMEEVTGSRINWPWFHVEGSSYVAWAWDAQQPPPADPNDYWLSRTFRPLLVDLEQGISEPYPDLDGTLIVSSEERGLDGKPFYEWSETGFIGEENHADVVELTPSGIRRTFSLPSLWALARIR